MTTVNKDCEGTTNVVLTENEMTIFRIIVTKGTHGGGVDLTADGESNGIELPDVYRVAVAEGKRKTSVKGTLGRLQDKGLILMYGRDFECYFDGEVTKEGLEYWSRISTLDNVSSQKQINENRMENSNEDSVIDERIVRMNAILGTKLSAVSKGKRESLKAQKSSIKFLLDEWDNENSLIRFTSDSEIKQTQYELYCIAKSRLDQLRNKRIQEERQKIDFSRIAEFQGNPSDLTKDENQVWAIFHGYYDDDPVMQSELKEDAFFVTAFEYREKMLADAALAAKTEKSVKTTSEERKSESKQKRAPKHKVGDLHRNGKWIWTEYKPGKFDWRNIPKDGKKFQGHKSRTEKGTEKPEKKSVTAKKVWTLRDFEERCVKGLAKNLTKTQKEAKKYLLRGYKIELIENSNNCFLKKDSDTKSSFFDSVQGLFRKLGMEIPKEMLL